MAKILVIDDDEFVLNVFEEMLERGGHSIIKAYNGEEGIQCYQREQPDLVITDMAMPGRDGLEVIQELKQDFPDVKIIATAGYGGKVFPKAKAMGVDGVIEKPADIHTLLKMVRELLDEGS